MTHTATLVVVLVVVFASQASIASPGPCTLADAALKYKGINYLFVGHDYLTLTDELTEKSIGNKYDEWGGLQRVDAALIWNDNPDSWYSSDYPMFFEGPSYSYYWLGSTHGTYPIKDDDKFKPEWNLDDGVDAAANMGETKYFFKGCNYISLLKGHTTEPISFKDTLGIPCDVHAAIDAGDDTLAIFRYDQMWFVNTGNGTTNGPLDANKLMDLNSVRLCGEHEDAGVSITDDDDDADDDAADDDEEDKDSDESDAEK